MLSHHAALVYVMVMVSAADRNMTDAEMKTIGEIVNFLPIPILDGGHMVFLVYEWIRRKPASEAVRIWATYIGLAMILCLMIFVLTIDINRFFFTK